MPQWKNTTQANYQGTVKQHRHIIWHNKTLQRHIQTKQTENTNTALAQVSDYITGRGVVVGEGGFKAFLQVPNPCPRFCCSPSTQQTFGPNNGFQTHQWIINLYINKAFLCSLNCYFFSSFTIFSSKTGPLDIIESSPFAVQMRLIMLISWWNVGLNSKMLWLAEISRYKLVLPNTSRSRRICWYYYDRWPDKEVFLFTTYFHESRWYVPCGYRKTSPRTSLIVWFIFSSPLGSFCVY